MPVVDQSGRPTIAFLRDLNGTVDVVNALAQAQAAIVAAQAAADVAQAAAVAAQTAADNAQASNDATTSEQSIQSSYVDNYTPPLIEATSGGAVTIATHDRVYGNPSLNPTVSVTGASISTGALSGSLVRVYYDDPARAGGAVTYQFTVDPDPPPVQTGSIHSVGAVQIPNVGSQDGMGLQPPGYIYL